MPRGMFVKIVPMMLFENTTSRNTISARKERKTNHHIIIAMKNNLDDQIFQSKYAQVITINNKN